MSRQQINLFDPALRRRREWLDSRSLLGGLALVLAYLLLHGGWLFWQNAQLGAESARLEAELDSQRSELTRLDGELAQRRLSPAVEQALRQAEGRLKGREQLRDVLHGGALGSTKGFAEYLRAFARQGRDGLWLVGLEIGEGGRSLTLEGRALNAEMLPPYIRSLAVEPVLRGRAFAALDLNRVEAAAPAGSDRPAKPPTTRDGQAAMPLPPFNEFVLKASDSTEKSAAGERR